MSAQANRVVPPTEAAPHATHPHVRGLGAEQRASLVISARRVDGQWVVLSRYGDARWQLLSKTTNRRSAIAFDLVDECFRDAMREVMYRFHVRGRAGRKRPEASTAQGLFHDILPFLKHLTNCKVTRLSETKRLICTSYVKLVREYRMANGKPLTPATLDRRLRAVEALFELSQHSADPMPVHPWPGTSPKHMAGLSGSGMRDQRNTPLMPDDVFAKLFQTSWDIVQRAPTLLDLRDESDRVKVSHRHLLSPAVQQAQSQRLLELGWQAGLASLAKELLAVRTACYVVLASVSGCRNHELAWLQTGSAFSTQRDATDEDADVVWWMRSISAKTDEGPTTWMIPRAGVEALRVMERWAVPFQQAIADEIDRRRTTNPRDPEIAEAQRHSKAIFLVQASSKKVRTLSLARWFVDLRNFAKVRCGLDWPLASHQFRRTFAHYAARSQFGDLRYLKEHFKHWSMDMTLGYALDESQDLALYLEVEDRLDDIKAGLVETWLKADAPLAGGYGTNIVAWRGSEAVTIFKSHGHMVKALAGSTPIRSNGHAWCTADDNLCVGNDLERTRCSKCDNAVIGQSHGALYRGLYDHLMEVAVRDDIGVGAMQLVQRDIERCASVLKQLGQEPQGTPA